MVLLLLVFAFAFLLFKIYQSYTLLIKVGAKDSEIKKEYADKKHKTATPKSKALNIINLIILSLIWIALLAIVCSTLFITFTQDNMVGDIPMLKTVESGSMSKKHEYNTYLEENNLNDQFDTSDLVLIHKTPDIKDIELYDIILYKINDDLVLHRVIYIEYDAMDPELPLNFLTQGDNVETFDEEPVMYEQIRGVYKGEKIHNLGYFVRFMRSSAGYICLILVAIVTIFLPIIEHKLDKTKEARLKECGFINTPDEEQKDKDKKDN